MDWRNPDPSKFINPWDSKPLLGYYRDLLTAYGYIRLLGLPQIKDNPDIPIESLFVEPEFSETPISAESPLESWGSRMSVTDALINHQSIVILGDPGAGKTSLQSWLVTQFCRSGSSRLQCELGPLVPIPIVLRELTLPPNLNWEILLDLFLAQPTASKIADQRGLVQGLLLQGQVLVMLDGLDEISNEAAKELLKNAVLEGMIKHSRCRWLMTSRIVGYDRIPFHNFGLSYPKHPPLTIDKPLDTTLLATTATLLDLDQPAQMLGVPLESPLWSATDALIPIWSEDDFKRLQLKEWVPDKLNFGMGNVGLDPFLSYLIQSPKLLYMAPFDDRQVELLVRKWYAEREANASVRDECIQELLNAIRQNASTQRLARVPNLLTMMALIHRVRARLPQGRVNLYRDITDAYLQTIDDFRGLKETAYTLPQKKLWLARVAFEMQSRRKFDFTALEQAQQEGILVGRADLLEWLAEVMDVPDPQDRISAAEKFVDYLQRRTGLFIERSPGQWAFLHLSFQEYFAACFLAEEVTSPDWLSSDYSRMGCRPSDIQKYAERQAWKETLVFLFELLGQERPRWSDRVAAKVFEKAFSKPQQLEFDSDSPWRWQTDSDVLLLAEVSVNAYCCFSNKFREEAWGVVWRCSFPTGSWVMENPAADALFASAPQFASRIWGVCSTVANQCHKRSLNLCDCKRLEDISPLAQVSNLEGLDLSGSTIRRGLSDVAKLSNLRHLQLTWPGNLDNPLDLTQFVNLEDLRVIVSSQNLDLSPLAALLLKLRRFCLYSFQVMQGFEVLGANHRLTSAGFDSSNKNETYSFLRHLLSIRSLWLRSSRVIERLDELPILSLLERLDLMAFQSLKDVNPPASLKELKYLSLRGCVKLADLSPLSNYTKLEKLELRNCPQVVSIESLTECPNLSHITVEHCAKLSRIPDSLKPKLTMR